MNGLQLLAPIGLVALVGIPLVIFFHMRHTTPVERSISTLRFWQMTTPAPTQDSRWRRPPLSILLVLQLLAVGALGLAFAHPAITTAWAGLTQPSEPVHLILVLDGSTSMGALDTDTGQTRFDLAKNLAADRIGALHEGDVASVLLIGSNIRSMDATDNAGLRVLGNRLRDLAIPGGRADVNAALSLAGNLVLPNLNERVVLLTDGAVAVDPAVVDALGAPIELVQIGRPDSANYATVQFVAKSVSGFGNDLDVFARLANFSDRDIAIPVTLSADDIEIETRTISIPAGATVDYLSNSIPSGSSRLRLEMNSADVLPADNSAELVISNESDLAQRILLVSNTPLILQRALSALPGAQITTVSTFEYLAGDIEQGPFDLTVFENYAPGDTRALTSPVLFIHPPIGGMLLRASGVMSSTTVEQINANDPLLNGVDLTGMTFGETPVHELSDDEISVVAGERGPLIYRGIVLGSDESMVVFTFDLQETTLPQQIAFPILMANTVRALAPPPLPISVALGEPLSFSPRTGVSLVTITAPDGNGTDIPTASDLDYGRSVVYTETGMAGEYRVQEFDDAGIERASGIVMVDAGHPLESNLQTNPDLVEILARANATPASTVTENRSSDLWPVLVTLALVVLIVEWFWTIAQRRPIRGVVRSARS